MRFVKFEKTMTGQWRMYYCGKSAGIIYRLSNKKWKIAGHPDIYRTRQEAAEALYEKVKDNPAYISRIVVTKQA